MTEGKPVELLRDRLQGASPPPVSGARPPAQARAQALTRPCRDHDHRDSHEGGCRAPAAPGSSCEGGRLGRTGGAGAMTDAGYADWLRAPAPDLQEFVERAGRR
jgi:hypothetical protein